MHSISTIFSLLLLITISHSAFLLQQESSVTPTTDIYRYSSPFFTTDLNPGELLIPFNINGRKYTIEDYEFNIYGIIMNISTNEVIQNITQMNSRSTIVNPFQVIEALTVKENGDLRMFHSVDPVGSETVYAVLDRDGFVELNEHGFLFEDGESFVSVDEFIEDTFLVLKGASAGAILVRFSDSGDMINQTIFDNGLYTPMFLETDGGEVKVLSDNLIFVVIGYSFFFGDDTSIYCYLLDADFNELFATEIFTGVSEDDYFYSKVLELPTGDIAVMSFHSGASSPLVNDTVQFQIVSRNGTLKTSQLVSDSVYSLTNIDLFVFRENYFGILWEDSYPGDVLLQFYDFDGNLVSETLQFSVETSMYHTMEARVIDYDHLFLTYILANASGGPPLEEMRTVIWSISCAEYDFGPMCNLVACFGIVEDEISVCHGKGVCTASDTCICNSEAYGEDCSLYKCFGILSNETSACNSTECIGTDICDCETNFFGSDCLPCECVNGDCSSGLSGNGSCACFGGWEGDMCDQEIPSPSTVIETTEIQQGEISSDEILSDIESLSETETPDNINTVDLVKASLLGVLAGLFLAIP